MKGITSSEQNKRSCVSSSVPSDELWEGSVGGRRRRKGEEERVSVDSTGEDDVGKTYRGSNIELFGTTHQKKER